MHKVIKNNVTWIGKLDWELKNFHGSDYSVFHGSSQNAYLIKEEKKVLIDTVWKPHSSEFIDNLQKEIDLKEIDFIVINHGEVEVNDGKPEWICNECRFDKKDLAQWTIEGPRHISRNSVVSQGHYEKPNPLKNNTKNIE